MDSDEQILIHKNPPLGWLIINRAEKRNSFTRAMWRLLVERARELEAGPDIRVIILRGAGSKTFSAGADISEMTGGAPDPGSREGGAMNAFDDIARLAKPTIAMIHGFCMGGGCALAISTDLRLASTDAHFAITPARLGLAYDFRAVKRLVDEVGPAAARYILMSAQPFAADRALSMGLIHEVHEPDTLEEAVRTLALRIAENAPKTVRLVRESIRQATLAADERDMETIRRLHEDCMQSEDLREGVTAFVEKRAPRFQDK